MPQNYPHQIRNDLIRSNFFIRVNIFLHTETTTYRISRLPAAINREASLALSDQTDNTVFHVPVRHNRVIVICNIFLNRIDKLL